jgi:hypothetical protein
MNYGNGMKRTFGPGDSCYGYGQGNFISISTLETIHGIILTTHRMPNKLLSNTGKSREIADICDSDLGA